MISTYIVILECNDAQGRCQAKNDKPPANIVYLFPGGVSRIRATLMTYDHMSMCFNGENSDPF